MNFLPKLHKNSILTGPVESFCLACGCLLQSEEESYAHISESEHRSKLEAIPRPDNFKDEGILKIKEGYYCPYCNIILPTIKRVGIHVTELSHRNTKYAQSITRNSGFIFVYDEVVIDEKSWHGFDGSTCFVCNEDYNDEDQHKKEVTHVLNLIQSKCEFGEAFIYRKVDEDSFFCLICGTIHYHDEKTNHHESEQHLQHYDASKKLGISIRDTKQFSLDDSNNNTLNVRPKIIENKTETDKVVIKEFENKTTSSETASVPEKEPVAPNVKEKHETSETTAKDLVKVDDKSNINENKSSTENFQVKKPEKQPTNNCNQNLYQGKTKKGQDIKESTQPANEVKAAKYDINEPAPDMYNYLKACKFVIKIPEGCYCALCDHIITDINSHIFDKHHKVLYAKHVARNAHYGNTNGTETADTNKTETKAHQSCTKSTKNNKNTIPTSKNSNPNSKTSIVQDNKQETDANNSENKIHIINDSKGGTENEKATKILQATKDKTTVCKETKELKKNTNNENPKTDLENVKIEEKNKNVTEQMTETASNVMTKCTEQDKLCTTEKETAVKETHKATKNPSVGQNKLDVSSKSKPIEKTVVSKHYQKKIKKAYRKVHATSNYIPEDIPSDKSEPTTNIEATKYVNGTNKGIDNTNKLITVSGDKVTAKETDDIKIKTEKLSNILERVSQFDHMPDDLVINGKYVLGNLSLMLIVNEAPNLKCVACNEILSHNQLNIHILLESHRFNIEESLVVTSLDDEFIRKVNFQGYHCGYCNLLLSSWRKMEGHLQCYRHKDAKTSALWRLVRFHQHLRHGQNREVRSILSSIQC